MFSHLIDKDTEYYHLVTTNYAGGLKPSLLQYLLYTIQVAVYLMMSNCF